MICKILPTVSMARSDVCATKLDDKVLQMQTLTEAVEGIDELFVSKPVNGSCCCKVEEEVGAAEEDIKLRSHMMAGKSVRHETMLMVIKFITNL